MSFTNYHNIPLPLAVWLAADNGYDLNRSENVVSATSLMKPIKSHILQHRVAEENADVQTDVKAFFRAKMGSAVHVAVEDTWLNSALRYMAFRNLGYPDHVIDSIQINPTEPSDNPEFNFYIEQRTSRALGKWIVSGKFDFVWKGRVMDIKTTKTFNWMAGTNDEKYQLQGSIYRWLNPDIITDDYIDIMMLFTDWSPLKAQVDKQYPKSEILVRTLPLLTLAETEHWIKSRIELLEENWDKHQNDMPRCTPTELWQDKVKWAYYKNPKAQRATKLYDTAAEAHAHKTRDGVPGSVVVKREAEPKFCNYCEGRAICLQAEQYVAEGLLK